MALAAACGGEVDNGTEADAPEVIIDTMVITIDTVSSTNDCDPAEGNPGDFRVFIESFLKDDYAEFGAYDLVEVSTPSNFTLNAEKGDERSVSVGHTARLQVPRIDNQGFAATVHVVERDSGTEDAHLTSSTSFYYDADLDCWYHPGNSACGAQRFTRSRTFREDRFILFNSDDEGCQIGVRWSVTPERG